MRTFVFDMCSCLIDSKRLLLYDMSTNGDTLYITNRDFAKDLTQICVQSLYIVNNLKN